jgi:hypothetical protein
MKLKNWIALIIINIRYLESIDSSYYGYGYSTKIKIMLNVLPLML